MQSKKDEIVEDLIKEFKQRSERGIQKYGTTLEQNDTDDFFQHLKEELMDAALYLQKIQSLYRFSIEDILDEMNGDRIKLHLPADIYDVSFEIPKELEEKLTVKKINNKIIVKLWK